ncbi:hypothetical protein Tco_1174885 [Tanacetum coccineum]
MGNEELSTIPKKESNEVIKSSVEDHVLIPSESKDTFGSDSKCDLPSYNDFYPINVFEEKSMTFSNPLFDSNDDFTSSDDESLSNEDVPEDNIKIYSNPLFEFDDEYISSDINPLFDEVIENIESKDSYVSNLDEPALLVTPISDANEDECFDPGVKIDEIDAFLDIDVSTNIKNSYHDSKGDIIYLESLLINDTIPNLPPKCTLLTQGMRSIISIVSISPEGFLPSILLLVVIIVTVVIVVVMVILVVVFVAIIGVVIVVTLIGVVVVVMIIGVVGVVVVSSIIKLSFVIIGSLLSIVLCYLIH